MSDKIRVWDDGHCIKIYYLNDEFHREDGPAIEYVNGTKFWYLNGRCHRIAGSAIEYANGIKFWYIAGKEYSEEEYNKIIKIGLWIL